MHEDYKRISIFRSTNKDLLIIPSGECKKYGGTMDLDIVNELKYPYDVEALEQAIMTGFSQCYSMEPDEDSKQCSIEKYFKVKGFTKATKDLFLVGISWFKDKGYTVMPTKNTKKQGFDHIRHSIINIETDYQKGQLAQAVLDAFDISE